MDYNFPFKIDRKVNKTATTDYDTHVRQLIELILFTSQGERVNRHSFGSGLNQMIFAPNSDEIATATQFLIQGALQQWLSDLIRVESVIVKSDNSKLNVTIQYIIKLNQQRQVSVFTKDLNQ